MSQKYDEGYLYTIYDYLGVYLSFFPKKYSRNAKGFYAFFRFSGMDLLVVSKRRNNITRKLLLAAGITAICFLIFRTSPGFSSFMKVRCRLNI